MNKKVAIIGGGISGAAACVHTAGELMRQGIKDAQISIFDPAGIGPGLAYARDLPDSFLLNHESALMGMVNVHNLDAPSAKDFHHWLKQNKEFLSVRHPHIDFDSPNAYVPRSLYGHYVHDKYLEAKQAAESQGITLHERAERVEDIRRGLSGFLVVSNDQIEPFGKVILATGHWYSPIQEEWKATGRAFSAYPPQRYLDNPTIPPHATLLIKGTGLTATDVAVTALESGKYKKVVMASRRGHLRGLRGAKSPYTPQVLTMERLEAQYGKDGPIPLDGVLKLFQEEMEKAYARPLDWERAVAPRNMQAWLRNQAMQVNAGKELRWRSVLDSLDSVRQYVYERLEPADQERYLDDWRSLYLSYRAAMPPETGRKLLSAMRSGALEVAGGAQWTRYNGETEKFEMEVAHRADGSPLMQHDIRKPYPAGTVTRTYVADAVIEATGQSRNPRHSTLLKNMIESGAVMENPLGGIKTDLRTHKAITAGGPDTDLYAIGPMVTNQYSNPPNTLVLTDESRVVAKDIAQSLAQGQERSYAFIRR